MAFLEYSNMLIDTSPAEGVEQVYFNVICNSFRVCVFTESLYFFIERHISTHVSQWIYVE